MSNNLNNIVLLGILSVFVIGSFYDERLQINDFNLSYFFVSIYIAGLLVSFSLSPFDKKISGYVLFIYSLVLFQTMINWSIWGLNDYNNNSLNILFILTVLTLPMCFYISSLHSIEKINIFIKYISLVGGLIFLLGILQVLFLGGNVGEQRISILGGGPIVFSRWIGVFSLAVFYDNIKLKKFKYPILILCIFLMLLSGSRGPIIFLLFVFLVVRTIKIQYFLFLLLMILYLVVLNYQIIFNLIDATPVLSRLFGFAHGSSLIDGSSTTMRLMLYYDSIQLIKDNLFGYGIGNFSVYSSAAKIISMTSYPHNFLMEIFVEHGILIFSVIVYLIIRIFNTFFNWIRLDSLNQNDRLVFAIWLFCLMNSFVSGNLSDSRILLVFSCIFFKYAHLKNFSKG